MADTCVAATIKIYRYTSGGTLEESYTQTSHTTAMNCRSMRIGGCWDASFNVIRRVGEIGTLAMGDQIIISYDGTTLWRGWVDDYESRNNDLEVRCVGAWKAVKSVYPDNARYGSEADSADADEENEHSDVYTCSAIIQSLIDTYLSASTLTLDEGISTNSTIVKMADFDGTTDLLTICADLAMRGGNWAVGVDEDLIFYLTDPATYDAIDFKACEGNTYQITDIQKIDSVAWTDTPTSVVIKGANGYEETFDCDWLGYNPVQIAGIDIINRQVITLPYIGPTEESTYSCSHTGATIGDVVSVDAAKYADELFWDRNKPRYLLECANLNKRVYPWTNTAKVWDPDSSYLGEFVIDMVEYESRDNNISIKTMELSEL